MAFIDVAWQWAGRLALNGGRFAMAWGFLQMAKLMIRTYANAPYFFTL
jgi:hypothetical protein